MRTEPSSQSEHYLQLFDSPESLSTTVADFIATGFERGDNALIVATPRHCELLSQRLGAIGRNVQAAMAANRLVVTDADQLLETFMRQCRPVEAAFDEMVGGLVRRLSAGRRLWIYGEMVDVLTAQGNYKGVQMLEDLWNGLARRECFTLLCGYASGHFGNLKTAPILGAICAAHDHVHRDTDDILAEFLLDHPDVKSAACKSGPGAGAPEA